jgi:hypothetical protein
MVKLGGLSEESNIGFGYAQISCQFDQRPLRLGCISRTRGIMLLPTQVACQIRVCRCMGITAFYGAPLEDAAAMTLLQGVYDAGTAHSCADVTVSAVYHGNTRGNTRFLGCRFLGCRHFDTAEIYKTGNPFADGVCSPIPWAVRMNARRVASLHWNFGDLLHKLCELRRCVARGFARTRVFLPVCLAASASASVCLQVAQSCCTVLLRDGCCTVRGALHAPIGDDVYNETVVGKFFATVPRDSFTVATKFMPPKCAGCNSCGSPRMWQRAACNTQHAACIMQRASRKHACNMQRAACEATRPQGGEASRTTRPFASLSMPRSRASASRTWTCTTRTACCPRSRVCAARM